MANFKVSAYGGAPVDERYRGYWIKHNHMNGGCWIERDGAYIFDFGMTRVARIWRGAAAAARSWSIQFADGRTFHVVRRTGNLKEWC